jgi:hypothetical protein
MDLAFEVIDEERIGFLMLADFRDDCVEIHDCLFVGLDE